MPFKTMSSLAPLPQPRKPVYPAAKKHIANAFAAELLMPKIDSGPLERTNRHFTDLSVAIKLW